MANKKFKNLTLTQKTLHYFKNKKYKEVASKSMKYRIFFKDDPLSLYYFVGKSGAVRYGETVASTKSRSISQVFKTKVQAWSLNQEQEEMVKIL